MKTRTPSRFINLKNWVFGCLLGASLSTFAHARPNILFIAVDDLRPELNCYGATQIISPNIDQLARTGIVFRRAFCNVPVCGATRASLLTGLYPLPNRFTTYGTRVDEEAKGVATLPQYFKNNGYRTYGIGKIFHHPNDGLAAWSSAPVRPDYPNDLAVQEEWRDYRSAEYAVLNKQQRPGGAAGPAWEDADVPDETYYDGKTAALAVSKLTELSHQSEPFFLALGFIRPHLPFNSPKRYWDMYSPEKIALADNPFFPKDAPKEARFNSGELRSYTNIPQGHEPIGDATALKLRHGYYAAVSYVDAQIGKVLKRLSELGLADNTIVILWGDHGWSLGEHTHWGKHTCFNNSLQTPLIMRVPGGLPAGQTESLVSYIDIYPTLCDLAGLPAPAHLQGHSLKPILQDPKTDVNQYVYTRWEEGETVISKRFNYTEYREPATGKVISRMLYDRTVDPKENVNVVEQPQYQKEVRDLATALEKHLEDRLSRHASP